MIKLYNFERQLEQPELDRVQDAVDFWTRARGGSILQKHRYVLIDNKPSVNQNTGQSRFGTRSRDIDSVVLYPDSLSLDAHRVKGTSRLAGTIVHEIGHTLADELRDEWIKRFGWIELAPPNILPGGAQQLFAPPADGAFVTEYCKTQPEEDICDSAVAYYVDPQLLDEGKREMLESKLRLSEAEPVVVTQKVDLELPRIEGTVKYVRKNPIRIRSRG